MRKFKYLGKTINNDGHPIKGNIYPGDYTWGEKVHTVLELASTFYITHWEEVFDIPNEWCIKVTEENIKLINEWKVKQRFSDELISYRGHSYVEEDGCVRNYANRYEITTEQFKKYVLKQNSMEEELIGYKVREKFLDIDSIGVAIATIEGYQNVGTSINDSKYNKTLNITCKESIKKLKEAGILETWFEPVYKSKYSLPKINGYDGRIEKDYVVYGNNCAWLGITLLREIYNTSKTWDECYKNIVNDSHNRTINSITLSSDISITIDEIKQILDYVDNQ